jgi:hypothetical protein
MDEIEQTFPELLARDLARSQDVFRTRSLTAGIPAASMALECQLSHVPRRNPGRVVTSTLHRTTSEIALCSPRESARVSADTARRQQRARQEEDWPLKSPGARLSSLANRRQDHMFAIKETHMKQGDKKTKRLFLNSLDDEWVSDSSVDIEPGTSPPSVRTRKQSVTTAATSVERHSVLGGVGEACLSPASSLSKEAALAPPLGRPDRSWMDLDLDMLRSEVELDGGVASVGAAEYSDGTRAHSATPSSVRRNSEQLSHVDVPRRRSSLSHQVTTVVIGEATQVRLGCAPHKVDLEPALKPPTPSLPQEPSSVLPKFYDSPDCWEATEAGSTQIAPASCRQYSYEPHYALTATSSYQLPSLPPQQLVAHDVLDTSQPPRHHAGLFHRLRKTPSHSKMPIITHVQSWLDSSATASHLTSPTDLTIDSPTTKASIGSVRVAAEVLETLRISVANFPDTMLRTSSLTVQTIRSYSRKLRRGGTSSGDRGFSRDSDDYAFTASDGHAMDSVPVSMDRKSSLGNLRLKKLCLRGKNLHLSTRQAPAYSLPSAEEDDLWRPVDHHDYSVLSNTSPSRKSSEVSACVGALRGIFPEGTDYLLDGLYAHLIAYNYINSLCGTIPHLPSSAGHPGLRPRPSLHFPPGVTSRADLELQDRDDPAVRELQDEVATTGSTLEVPEKAASLLGLGATDMSKPVRPRPGTSAGRKEKQRKTTPPAASFSVSLGTESAMYDLRDAIASNIKRLVETVKQCSAAAAGGDSDEDSEDAAIMGQNARELDPYLLRTLCEVVRCYEESA